MLSTAVRLLHEPDTLMPTLRILGVRLIARGVDEGRYATAAHALMEMLATMLGDEFTPDVRDAWLAVCVMFSETMKSAADDAVVVG
jgi:hemoglobin-like flavoprotein